MIGGKVANVFIPSIWRQTGGPTAATLYQHYHYSPRLRILAHGNHPENTHCLVSSSLPFPSLPFLFPTPSSVDLVLCLLAWADDLPPFVTISPEGICFILPVKKALL